MRQSALVLKTLIAMCCTLMLAMPLIGCEAMMAGGAIYSYGIFKDPEVNVKAKSYAAADYLIQQASNFVRKDVDILKMLPLNDTERPKTHAEIGDLIPAHIGERLRQIGYKVDLSAVMPSYAAPEIDTSRNVEHYYVTGSYTIHSIDMDVALQIVGAQSGKIYGTFDYTMPLTREMRDMGMPEAQIYRPSEAKVRVR